MISFADHRSLAVRFEEAPSDHFQFLCSSAAFSRHSTTSPDHRTFQSTALVSLASTVLVGIHRGTNMGQEDGDDGGGHDLEPGGGASLRVRVCLSRNCKWAEAISSRDRQKASATDTGVWVSERARLLFCVVGGLGSPRLSRVLSRVVSP